MEKEVFLTGYCRTQDQSRMVAVEICDGEVEVDCGYIACPYAPNCRIAQQIRELLIEN